MTNEEFFKQPVVQVIIAELYRRSGVTRFARSAQEALIAVQMAAFCKYSSTTGERLQGWSSQWGSLGDAEQGWKKFKDEGRAYEYVPEAKTKEKPVGGHVHQFGAFSHRCSCGVTGRGSALDAYEQSAVKEYVENLAPSEVYGPARKPMGMCGCGQQVRTARLYCSDCLAIQSKRIITQDLDRRIAVAKVDIDPTSNWSAWATPSAES